MLRYKDILIELEKTAFKMKSEKLEIDLVCHLGNKTKQIGDYFANFFECENIEFPSLNRPNRNASLARILNKMYFFIPENILKTLSEQYKRIYQRDSRILKKDFDLEETISNHKSLLLVDDNSFTGKTFDGWKRMINGKVRVHTFSITITGDYIPDYFCIRGWRSFEWRLIGI